MQARDPLYRDAAHVTVDTGPQSTSALANRVVNALRRHDPQAFA
jgi:shikimate kinase